MRGCWVCLEGYFHVDILGITGNTIKMKPRIVLDTNIVVSGLKSAKGVSYYLLSLLKKSLFEICVTVPLILEYETVLKRVHSSLRLGFEDINDFIDQLCFIAHKQDIFYLWRPFLSDPADNMVLEAAVASKSSFIITYNKQDFHGVEKFNLKALTPLEFLKKIGAVS